MEYIAELEAKLMKEIKNSQKEKSPEVPKSQGKEKAKTPVSEAPEPS